MIIAGEKFFYSTKTGRFEIDENPYGEPICKPIQNVKIIDGKLNFETLYKKEETEFIIASKFDADKQVFPYLVGMENRDFYFSETDVDGIEIAFDKDKLVRIIFTRYENLVSKDFLTILLEKERSIITYPFQKFDLKSIIIDKNTFKFETEEKVIEWQLQMNTLLIELIKRLIESGNVQNY
ncbi:hypothetical protein B0I22_1472 [Epilithonimonas xixisoli]|uniref:Uncharacterized protein n=2 Tax=Epilithonimonas xixisoli TaxID=1476462 RepID=A0A4R8IC36_9FLAO|nr:hypothetical protein B0I22_1472 [Epilithonimonas xixisoli]